MEPWRQRIWHRVVQGDHLRKQSHLASDPEAALSRARKAYQEALELAQAAREEELARLIRQRLEELDASQG